MSVAQKKHANTHDKAGRPYAKLSELRAGDKVELDGVFTCHPAGVVTLSDDNGDLYFPCNGSADTIGHNHYIDGQADDGEHLIGIYKVE